VPEIAGGCVLAGTTVSVGPELSGTLVGGVRYVAVSWTSIVKPTSLGATVYVEPSGPVAPEIGLQLRPVLLQSSHWIEVELGGVVHVAAGDSVNTSPGWGGVVVEAEAGMIPGAVSAAARGAARPSTASAAAKARTTKFR
jgi:hypothetical protein